MKKIIFLLLLSLTMVTTVAAQEAAFTSAVARYRTAKTASAKVEMVKHNKAMTKSTSATGTLSMADRDKVAIVCNGGKDQLVMNGNTFTMVMGGHKRVASAKTASQFAAFKAVLLSVLNCGKTDISKVQGVKVTTGGGNVIITMTPTAQKHLMFTSFVLTIDRKTGALETLTLNSKRGYTKYTFSGFRFGAAVNDKVFLP